MCVGRKNRGGDEIYGESIYTKRQNDWKLPIAFSGKTMLSFRKRTFQDSRYGTTSYIANQNWFSTTDLGQKNRK
jgi:outer membrane receptor for ferrienterochelin and colicins